MSSFVENSEQHTAVDTEQVTVVNSGNHGSFNGQEVTADDSYVAGSNRPPTDPSSVEAGSWLGRKWRSFTHPSPPMRGFWKGLGTGLLLGVGATIAGVVSGATFGALPLIGAAVTAAIVYSGGTATLGGIGGAIGYGLGKCRRKQTENNAETQGARISPTVISGSTSGTQHNAPRSPSNTATLQDANDAEKEDSQSRKSSQANNSPATSPEPPKAPPAAETKRKDSAASPNDADETEKQDSQPAGTFVPPIDTSVAGTKKRASLVIEKVDTPPSNDAAKAAETPAQDTGPTANKQNRRRPSKNVNRSDAQPKSSGGRKKGPPAASAPASPLMGASRPKRSSMIVEYDVHLSARPKYGLAEGDATVKKAVKQARRKLNPKGGPSNFSSKDWKIAETTLREYVVRGQKRLAAPATEIDLNRQASDVGIAAMNFRMQLQGDANKIGPNGVLSFNRQVVPLIESLRRAGTPQSDGRFAGKAIGALRGLYLEDAGGKQAGTFSQSDLSAHLRQSVNDNLNLNPDELLQPGNGFYLEMLAAARICHSLSEIGAFYPVASDLFNFYRALVDIACPQSADENKTRCDEIYRLGRNSGPEEMRVSESDLNLAVRRTWPRLPQLVPYRLALQTHQMKPTVSRKIRSTGAQATGRATGNQAKRPSMPSNRPGANVQPAPPRPQANTEPPKQGGGGNDAKTDVPPADAPEN